MSVIPQELIKDYNKALHELYLINGSLIKGIPASEPERFRGPQFHGGWLDELAAWEYLQDAWDMLQFGMRLGKKVRIICTTTPKPKDLIVDLVGREGDDVVITRASTYANIENLADNFKRQILQYEGTRLGRQEIEAELIDPEESGIVKREMFRLWPANKEFPKFEFILQSYDCAYTEKTVMTRRRLLLGEYLNHLTGRWESCSLMLGKTDFNILISGRRLLRNLRFLTEPTQKRKPEETLLAVRKSTLCLLKIKPQAYRSSKICKGRICLLGRTTRAKQTRSKGYRS
jgi:hypothetical protein